MAKNKDNQNVNKQSSKKNANIAGIVIGSVVIAAAAALGVLSTGPLVGIMSFGITALVTAVSVALGAIIIGYNAKKYKDKSKAGKINKEEKVEKQVEEVKAEKQVKEKAEEKVQVKKMEPILLPGKVLNVEEKQAPKMEEFLTNNIGPNTFAIYNKDADEILKDKNNNDMIYSISKDNRFRYALNDFSKEFNELPDCRVVVRDADDNATEHPIQKTTFRKDMTSLYSNIKTVRSNIKEFEQPELVEEKAL